MKKKEIDLFDLSWNVGTLNGLANYHTKDKHLQEELRRVANELKIYIKQVTSKESDNFKKKLPDNITEDVAV